MSDRHYSSPAITPGVLQVLCARAARSGGKSDFLQHIVDAGGDANRIPFPQQEPVKPVGAFTTTEAISFADAQANPQDQDAHVAQFVAFLPTPQPTRGLHVGIS